MRRSPVALGDEVTDPVTGIVGLAYARVQYLQGCDRIRLQPPAIFEKNKAAVVPDLWEVDEPQLDVVKRGKHKPRIESSPDNGGPSAMVPRGR